MSTDHPVCAISPCILPTRILHEGNDFAFDIRVAASPNPGSDLTALTQTQASDCPRRHLDCGSTPRRPRTKEAIGSTNDVTKVLIVFTSKTLCFEARSRP